MRYLITGGASFFGSHLGERLLDRGDHVVLLDNLSTGSVENIRHLKSSERMQYHLDNIENRQYQLPLLALDVIFFFVCAMHPTKEGMRRLIELMVYDTSFLTDELLEQRFQAALATHRPDAAEAAPPPWRDFTQELGKVKAKSLVIWGRDDRVVPFDGCLGFLWALPDAELHVFSKCGHWAQFEHPQEFNSLVLNFLAQ